MTLPLEPTGSLSLARCVQASRVAQLCLELAANDSPPQAGRRNLLVDSPIVRRFALDELAALLDEFEPRGFFPVRALLFDKTPIVNWKVGWHQDLSIAVAERSEVPGFTGWSLKGGVWHVQPPVEILERMITLRLHLDDCGPDNGPLKLISGSHRAARLERDQIEWWKAHGEIIECTLPAGGALLMRPLLLHSSSPARYPGHRRVLHVEFAAEQLPAGLRWAVEPLFSDRESVSLLTSTATQL